MSTDEDSDDFGDDDKTPGERPSRKTPSTRALQLAECSTLANSISSNFGELSGELGALAGRLDRFSPVEQRAAIERTVRLGRSILDNVKGFLDSMEKET